MPRKRQRKGIRHNAARRDASVSGILRRIARDLQLPPKSIVLVHKSGKRFRGDARVDAVLSHWGW